MSPRLRIALVLVLVLAAAAAALRIERSGARRRLVTTPSTTNGDPRGLLAAYRYLAAEGLDVGRLDSDGTAPRGLVVLPAPTARALRRDEVRPLLDVARRGGVVVVLAPTDADLADVQPALAHALEARRVRRRGLVEVEEPPGRDASEQVLRTLDDPVLGGGRYFLARVEAGIEAKGMTVLAKAGDTPVIVRRPLGEGTVYLFATPALLENHRIDLADNVRLLEGLALLARASGGRIVFDEAHHRAERAGEAGSILGKPALRAAAVQLALVGLVLLLSLSRRFGPVRPLVVDARRSALEYVDTLAALYRRAGDEAALTAEVSRDLRRRLFDRFGVSAGVDEETAAHRLSIRTGVPEDEILAAFSALRRSSDLRAGLAAAAALESRVQAPRKARTRHA